MNPGLDGRPPSTRPGDGWHRGGMTESGNDDIKAKMREALDRKQANDRGVQHDDHDRGSAEVHGPAGGKRVHRRKSG